MTSTAAGVDHSFGCLPVAARRTEVKGAVELAPADEHRHGAADCGIELQRADRLAERSSPQVVHDDLAVFGVPHERQAVQCGHGIERTGAGGRRQQLGVPASEGQGDGEQAPVLRIEALDDGLEEVLLGPTDSVGRGHRGRPPASHRHRPARQDRRRVRAPAPLSRTGPAGAAPRRSRRCRRRRGARPDRWVGSVR